MGDSECRNCRKQEEDTYWNYFQSVRFFLKLSSQFNHQLAIPEKFVNNVRKKVGNVVTIKGPSGTTWEVGVTAENNTLFFKHGWAKFVEDHSLEENDVLFFKYKGNSCFEVKIFDPQNLCEKEDSYFVKKCEHRGLVKVTEKRNVAESFDDMDDFPYEADKSSPSSVKQVKVDVQSPEPVSSVRPTRSMTRKAYDSFTPDYGRQGTSSMNRHVEYVSKRRPITDEEKHRTLQMAHEAQAASTKKNFIAIMRVTNVYKRFFMSIPYEWLYTNIPSKVDEVTLRMQDKKWHAKVYRNVSRGGLVGGWKSFALGNFLEEDDVCLFQLEDEAKDEGTILDVEIFRVVDQVTLPIRSGKTISTYSGGLKRPRRNKGVYIK